MTLRESRELADAIVRRQDRPLRVVGIIPRREMPHAEILIDAEPAPGVGARFVLNVDRSSREAFARTLRDGIVREVARWLDGPGGR